MPHEPAQEGQVGDEALDLGLVERTPQPLERLLARPSVGDQLRDHRVVADTDLVALGDAGVHADRLRQPEPLDPSRLREERLRVLGIEPHLDGVSLDRRRHVIDVLALRDADLLLDEVDPRDRLGNGMLDLDAAVQLEEVEVVAVEHELRRASAAVADRPGESEGGLGHAAAQVRTEDRRFLQHFLVATLDRALALAERENRPVAVREQLDLDVPRTLDVALAEDAVVAERGLGLAPGGVERLVQLGRPHGRRASRVRLRRPRL